MGGIGTAALADSMPAADGSPPAAAAGHSAPAVMTDSEMDRIVAGARYSPTQRFTDLLDEPIVNGRVGDVDSRRPRVSINGAPNATFEDCC